MKAIVAITALMMSAATLAAPTVEELLNRTDDMWRGASSKGTMRMRVRTERWDRELKMRTWSKGTDRTLVQILSPAKERGMATLKVENNIWNYLPKVDRTIKVPASMMSGSWMGSHLTNDDLVRDSRFADDYDCVFTALPDDGGAHYVIACTPLPDAPVVWGRVVLKIRAQDELVETVEWYDEKETLIRTMVHSEFEDVGDRRMARRMQVVPADKPEELTEIYYEDIAFDIDLPDRTFSLQALRK